MDYSAIFIHVFLGFISFHFILVFEVSHADESPRIKPSG